MKELFVDTSAWVAIVDAADSNHQSAVDCQGQIAGAFRLAITNYVLDELYTLLLMDLGYQQAVEVKQKLDLLADDGVLEVVWVDEPLAADAWMVFERFNQDKEWSFSDCVSYAVMKRRGIEEVFAFDHHFDQMSFIRRP